MLVRLVGLRFGYSAVQKTNRFTKKSISMVTWSCVTVETPVLCSLQAVADVRHMDRLFWVEMSSFSSVPPWNFCHSPRRLHPTSFPIHYSQLDHSLHSASHTTWWNKQIEEESNKSLVQEFRSRKVEGSKGQMDRSLNLWRTARHSEE
jgi:hypothetical protein